MQCFVYLIYSHRSSFSAIQTVAIISDRAANLDLCLALMAFSSEGFLHATPAATWDLSLYYLIQKTDTQIPQ
jgi:hypothetical protein